MSGKDVVKAERDTLAAEDALAEALAHGSPDDKRAARERLREAQRRVNSASEAALAPRRR